MSRNHSSSSSSSSSRSNGSKSPLPSTSSSSSSSSSHKTKSPLPHTSSSPPTSSSSSLPRVKQIQSNNSNSSSSSSSTSPPDDSLPSTPSSHSTSRISVSSSLPSLSTSLVTSASYDNHHSSSTSHRSHRNNNQNNNNSQSANNSSSSSLSSSRSSSHYDDPDITSLHNLHDGHSLPDPTLSPSLSPILSSSSSLSSLSSPIIDFDLADNAVFTSATWQSLYRLIRLCSIQPSSERLIYTIEREAKVLVSASACRLYLVTREGFHHPSRSASTSSSPLPPLPLSMGITGYVRAKREIVNLTNPSADIRYHHDIDRIGERISPVAMVVIPIESDTRLDGTGHTDVVAVLQAFKDGGMGMEEGGQGGGGNGRPMSSNVNGVQGRSGSNTSNNNNVTHHHTTNTINHNNSHHTSPSQHHTEYIYPHDTIPSSFSSTDCKILYRLGDMVGNMLKSTRSIDRAQALYSASLQSQKRSEALLDVAKALASETDLDRIVSIIVSQVPELLDSDRCTLYFVDRTREELIVTKGASKGRHKTLVSWIFGQCSAPELPFPKGMNEIRLPIKTGIAGHVAMSGETVNCLDAHMDHRFNSTMDKETGYRTRSLLSVPMIDSNGDIIGVVQAVNKNPLYGKFDQQDETLLKTFSAQAALAVRNSRLFETTKSALKKSDGLLEVTKALSSELKTEALINIICSQVQQLLSSERCTVFIVDKERRELYTSESMSFGMGPSLPIDREKSRLISLPIDRGIVGSVATSGLSINIPDAYQDARFNKTMDKETGFRTRSILCTAIKNHRNDIVGVLQILNKRDGSFNFDDEKTLLAFCAQAAVAIENSRLFQQTEKALNHALADQRNLKFMLSVIKNLFSDMHLTSMIDQMTMQVHHLLKADDCALFLVDEEKREFWIAKDDAERGGNHDHNGPKRYSYRVGIVGTVADTAETIRISHAAHADPRFSPLVDQRKGKTTHSILCCPIKAELTEGEPKVVGVISVRDEKDRGGFEQEEEKLLKVFCAQAAVAIINSKRFSAIMEQSEVKESDHSAADYLKSNRGMKLASDDINSFQFTSDEVKFKGAIGTGSYGEVYRAVVRNQIVAVKKLHVRNLKAEQVDAFCKEASLMCQLDHPNIVGFIGAVTEPSNLCIITQYCARGSLADLLIDDNIYMNFSCKVKFALDAAEGMLYLHNSNPVILHRDLKSDNLLVTENWHVKVADFGLTRFISEKKQMTQVGSPIWMSPEICMGKKYTEKADVYAFGIILWEIVTRLEPYEDKEPMQIVIAVVNDGLRPSVPHDYDDSPLLPLIKDCWQEDPNNRPPFEKVVERLRVIMMNIKESDHPLTGAHNPSGSYKKPQGKMKGMVYPDVDLPLDGPLLSGLIPTSASASINTSNSSSSSSSGSSSSRSGGGDGVGLSTAPSPPNSSRKKVKE